MNRLHSLHGAEWLCYHHSLWLLSSAHVDVTDFYSPNFLNSWLMSQRVRKKTNWVYEENVVWWMKRRELLVVRSRHQRRELLSINSFKGLIGFNYGCFHGRPGSGTEKYQYWLFIWVILGLFHKSHWLNSPESSKTHLQRMERESRLIQGIYYRDNM